MSKHTVAEVLVNELAEAGVERLYGLVGDSLNPVSDALRRDGRIRFIHVRHEECAALAAGAEAQLTGKLTACAGTSGPGHVHLINGLYDANRSYAPVLAIASHIPGSLVGMGYFQETHPDRLFNECSRFNEVISTPRQMPGVLRHAMQTAISQRGVAVVALPGDVAALSLPGAQPPLPLVPPTVPGPDPDDVQALAAEINAASRVTLYCGSGCQDAHDEVVALAEKIKAPVGYAWRGKPWVEPDNPNAVGMTGLLGFGGAHTAMASCDLLILLGTDMPYTAWYPTHTRIVQVDIRGQHLGRRARIQRGVVGDVKKTLQAVLPLVTAKNDGSHLDAALQKLAQSREKLGAYVRHVTADAKPHPEYLTSVINSLAAKDAIFTVDTGLNNVWAARYIDAARDRRILGSFNHGTMACALPLSIGAQLTCPDRQVVALCGDGGMTMLMGELLTLVQYNLPVKVIVYNNGELGFINLEMRAAGYPEYETSMKNPNFARMAEAIGMTGIRIERGDAVEAGIRQALNTPGPVLVDVTTDPEAMPLPPIIEPKEIEGFTLAMGKLVATGHLGEVIAAMTSNIRNF